jgi:4-alpha-glucanotransferase
MSQERTTEPGSRSGVEGSNKGSIASSIEPAPPVDRWGIENEYHDAFGTNKKTSDQTRFEILRAMGIRSDELVRAQGGESTATTAALGDTGPAVVPDAAPAAWVISTSEPTGRLVPSAGSLRAEDGATIRVAKGEALPAGLAIGYYQFTPDPPAGSTGGGGGAGAGAAIQVLVTPGRAYLPPDLRIWGWAAQLYAVRSRESWGMGDLADLGALAAWTRALGGEALMVNPLCAPAPIHPVEPSPYYPSSRRFRNPLYIRIENVPGAAALADTIAPLAKAGRALNAERRIDRDAIFDLKMRALEALWARFPGDRAFDAYRRELGTGLEEFCAYCVLAERHGKDWRQWPADFRHPAAPPVRELIRDEPRVAFHAWVQWLLDEQLREASKDLRVIHDMPIGFDIAGADGWCWQDVLAEDISIGCPPDGFNLDGQDWGLAPFIPSRLREVGFVPFIETVRAMLRHAGGLRIDHVMGIFRLFWIPRRLGTHGGTYVRYPSDELLAIVAIESHRAKAIIVGEDLGTVLPSARLALAREQLLSYRLSFFEVEPPKAYPELALSSVTTHDLATIAGIWTGDAIEHMRSAGVTPNEAGLRDLKQNLAHQTGTPIDAPVEEAVLAIYRALATAPSRILLATLDDALLVREQPNMPGTIRSWPNWCLALPQSLEEIEVAKLPRRLATILRR